MIGALCRASLRSSRAVQRVRHISTVQTKLNATKARKKVVSAGLLEGWTRDGILTSSSELPKQEEAEEDANILDVGQADAVDDPAVKKPASKRKRNKQKHLQELILTDEAPGEFGSVSGLLEQNYADYSESRELVDRYLDENPLPKSDEIDYEQQQAIMQFWQSEFAWERAAITLNKELFSNDVFRPYQQEAVNITLARKDLLLCLPTGGGKSLCYQLPGMVEKGVTIVVSPLIALIEDQLTALHKRGIKAIGLSSAMGAKNSALLYKKMVDPNFDIKFIYLTPERIALSKAFMDALEAVYKNGLLLRIAIDEAHCISEWGHDFRPSYRQLSVFAKRFSGVPIVAVTGTLTPAVRTDILQQLGVKDSAYVLQASFNRPNLWLEVLPRSDEGLTEVYNYIINTELSEKTGIIYCMTCREAEEMAAFLRSKDLQAAYYHGSLTNSVRSKTQAEWMDGTVKVICTTIAFGLGIDKKDVRYVVHAAMPASLEAYYQQVGRAGRDQQLSACAMFYNHKDMYRLRQLIKMGSEEAAQRRAAITGVNAGDAAAVRLMRKKKKLKEALDSDGHMILTEEEREQLMLDRHRKDDNGELDESQLTDQDIDAELNLFKTEKLDDVLKYCYDSNTCRRTQLLAYFGEHFDGKHCNDTCDVCFRKKLLKDAGVTAVPTPDGVAQEPKLRRLSRRYASIDPLLQRTLAPAKYQELRTRSLEEGVSLPQVVVDAHKYGSGAPRNDAANVVHAAVSPHIPRLAPAGAPAPPKIAQLTEQSEAAIKAISEDPLKRKAVAAQVRQMQQELKKKQKKVQESAGLDDDGHQESSSAADADERNEAPEDPDAEIEEERSTRRSTLSSKTKSALDKREAKMRATKERMAAVSTSQGSNISRRLYQICEEEAARRNLRPRDILSHVAIAEIVRSRPTTLSELVSIKGVGARKASEISDRVLPLFTESD